MTTLTCASMLEERKGRPLNGPCLSFGGAWLVVVVAAVGSVEKVSGWPGNTLKGGRVRRGVSMLECCEKGVKGAEDGENIV